MPQPKEDYLWKAAMVVFYTGLSLQFINFNQTGYKKTLF
jgi:hypothetical protein